MRDCSGCHVDIVWPQFDIDPPDTLPIRVHDRMCRAGEPEPAEPLLEDPHADEAWGIESHYDRMDAALEVGRDRDNRALEAPE